MSAILNKEWTRETLEVRVLEELASRGRRGADLRTIAARLGALADISVRYGPFVSIPSLFHAVSARFETARGLDTYLERSNWKRSARDLTTILNLLEENARLRLAPVVSEEIEAAMIKKAEKTSAVLTGSGPHATSRPF